MEFTQKYHLIELLAGDGVQSYRAVQTNTGRDVAVHLLVGGKTPENEALLVRLRAMQPPSMAKLIEVGEQQGNTYVVTMAPPYQRLDEWLAEQDRVAALAHQFDKAGFWKRPEAGSPGAAPSPVPGVPPVAAGTLQSMPPATPVRPVAPAPSEPDEFMRMFQGSVAPPTAVPGVPPAVAGTPTPVPPLPPTRLAPSPSEPGEFTRMFQSPVAPPTAVPGVPPVAGSRQTTPPPPTRLAPSPSEPGEFTRMFQSPAAPPAPVPGAAPVGGGGPRAPPQAP